MDIDGGIGWAESGTVSKVVITGMGCVSGLGSDAASTWDAAIAGRGAIRSIKRYAEGQQELAFEGIGAPAVGDALKPLRTRFSEKQLSGVDPFSAFGAA